MERASEREQNENTDAHKESARSHAFTYTSKQTGSYFMLLILHTNTGGAQSLFGSHTPHLGIKNECGPQSNCLANGAAIL